MLFALSDLPKVAARMCSGQGLGEGLMAAFVDAGRATREQVEQALSLGPWIGLMANDPGGVTLVVRGPPVTAFDGVFSFLHEAENAACIDLCLPPPPEGAGLTPAQARFLPLLLCACALCAGQEFSAWQRWLTSQGVDVPRLVKHTRTPLPH